MPLADFAHQVFNRHFDVVQIESRGRGTFQTHLLLFGGGTETVPVSLHRETGELVPVHFGEDHGDIGEPAVRDPHFGAVENIVLSVLGKDSFGPCRQGVRTTVILGQGVRGNQFARCQFGQVLFLQLVVGEIENRSGSNTAVGTEADGEGSESSNLLSDQHQGKDVEFHSAVLFGDLRSKQAEFGTFLENLLHQTGFLVLDPLDVRHDFVFHERRHHVTNHTMLFGEAIGGKNVVGIGLVQ